MSGCARNSAARTLLLASLSLCVLATALGGCREAGGKIGPGPLPGLGSGPGPGPGPGPGSRKGVLGPVELTYFVVNPIEEVPVSEDKDGSYYRAITITGLKDQLVEAKINNRLRSAFEAAKKAGLPPYRGIKARIPEGSKQDSQYITMHVMGSFNNVLSVALSVHASYTCPNSGSEHYGYVECLNFDLNTGGEIVLRDAFTDDSAYPGYLNAAVSEKLQKSHAAEEGWFFDMELGFLKLVKPFEGIAADQAFLVSERGLHLIFDHRTPQFETSMQAAMMRFPWTEFGDTVAITERFYDGKSDLYTSGAPAAKSLFSGEDQVAMPERIHEKVGLVNVYTMVVNSSTYPATVQEKIRALSIRDDQEIQRLNAAMAGMSQAFIDQYGGGYYDLSVRAVVAGRYVSVCKNIYSAIPSSDYSSVWRHAEYYCFNRKTGQEVLFEDLFVPGYDPAPAIKKTLRENLVSFCTYGDGQKLSRETEALILADENLDRMYRGIQGVLLSAMEMTLSLPPLIIGTQRYMISINVPYGDIGADNLVIFR